MSKELLSLSLTDMSFNNFESISTMQALKMLIQKGGDFEYNNATNLIIGIALLAIGGVIFIGENSSAVTNGTINYLNCNTKNCVLGVQYQVNAITYNKDFIVDLKYERPADGIIVVTYETSDPNSSRIGATNYNTIMYIMFGLGIFFLAMWYYLSMDNKKESIFFEPSVSIYTKTETPSGLYVVSKE
jgi:hypothetical protein